MSSNSDPLFNQYADMDFDDAKPVSEIPALAALQAQTGQKSRVTIRIDNDTLAFFKARANQNHASYQTLINDALKQFASGVTLTEVIRKTIQQELRA